MGKLSFQWSPCPPQATTCCQHVDPHISGRHQGGSGLPHPSVARAIIHLEFRVPWGVLGDLRVDEGRLWRARGSIDTSNHYIGPTAPLGFLGNAPPAPGLSSSTRAPGPLRCHWRPFSDIRYQFSNVFSRIWSPSSSFHSLIPRICIQDVILRTCWMRFWHRKIMKPLILA